MPTAHEVIDRLGLQPLPGEGGFFRQTWIAPGEKRPLGTAILYLITPSSFSALHRLDADEVFHFYLGDPCQQLTIAPDGSAREITLGQQILAGEEIQTVAPCGHWQGTRLLDGGEWALVGTTMAPGYMQSGFTLATARDLESLPAKVAERAVSYLANGA